MNERLTRRDWTLIAVCCGIALLSLYVVIDLFTHLDDFAGRGSLSGMLMHIGKYYSVRIAQIFDRLSEAIVLMAAFAAPTFACDKPAAPGSIPDGKTAGIGPPSWPVAPSWSA